MPPKRENDENPFQNPWERDWSDPRWADHSIMTQVALLSQTIKNLQSEIVDINNSMKDLRSDIKNINDMANKYRGGLLVVLALGGVIGTLVTLSDKIAHWFH
jgi:hypothetical protein